MRWVRQGALRVALSGAAWLLSCTPALAAPTWLPATDLSLTGHSASVAHIAVDAHGNAVTVWTRSDGSHFITQGASRPAGGNWQAPSDLSSAGQNAFDAELALDARGDAVAVWDRSNGANQIVQAAARPPGGTWQAPVDLSVGGQDAFNPQVAVDANGDAVAVWQRSNGTNGIVQSAVRPAATGVWQAPVDLSAAGNNALNPEVALDARGNAIAGWQRFNGSNFIVQAAERPSASATWQAPVDLSVGGQSADLPEVALTRDGTAIAAWERFDGANEIAQVAVRPPDAGWQAPVDLSAPGQNANNVQVAVNAPGDVAAVWARSNGISVIIQATVRPAGTGVWKAPVDISATGQPAATPQIALDPQGDAIADWERSNGTNEIVQAAVRPAGTGVWQAPVDLSATGRNAGDAQVTVDGQGNATVVWQRSNGTDTIVQAAGYDAAGPFLNGLSAPASGTVGVPVSFAVSPLDVWSPVAATTWSFGDGRSAAGASVRHIYLSAGAYTVALTSQDTPGNVTSTTARIAIGPTVKTRAPALSSVSETRRVWREGTGKAVLARRRAHKPPIGTRFAFTVDQTARVSFSFTQRVHRHKVTRGTLAYAARSGRRRLAFRGRIGNKWLPLGAYRLLITAANTATGRRSRTRTLRFTIVK